MLLNTVLPLLLLTALPLVAGWASISQAAWGVQLGDIQDQLRGGHTASLANPELNLGYLWSQPADPHSTHGLGGGIAWAWDPALCASILPAFGELVPSVGCDDLRATMRRSFSAWSSACLRGAPAATARPTRCQARPTRQVHPLPSQAHCQAHPAATTRLTHNTDRPRPRHRLPTVCSRSDPRARPRQSRAHIFCRCD